jgi:hypothetical protein
LRPLASAAKFVGLGLPGSKKLLAWETTAVLQRPDSEMVPARFVVLQRIAVLPRRPGSAMVAARFVVLRGSLAWPQRRGLVTAAPASRCVVLQQVLVRAQGVWELARVRLKQRSTLTVPQGGMPSVARCLTY